MSNPRPTQRPRTRKGTKPKTRPKSRSSAPDRSRVHIEIIARGLLAQSGKVLLCRSKRHGYYYLPGGHVEFSESARSALEREFLEETGLKVRAGQLALVTEGAFKAGNGPHHEINLVFHVEPLKTIRADRPLRSQEKGIRFEWVDPAAATDLDIRPESAKAFLASGGRVWSSHHAVKSSNASPGAAEWVSEIP